MSEERKEYLLEQIAETQQVFCEVMADRLREVGIDELELYFSALAKLVANLEERDKALKQVAQETFAEVAPLVMQHLM
jgi:hypothetical protein